ncbi:MAG TPA: tRNA (adenosine(37)-N6)-threonylcarbamoyltransferase complex dimerization subunit type 1 TsaB [Longimicrobiales bacterium]|nr:tRNA (adenosine(37)-N6)-threonylcarbamoyltransferase complex dimerization subunit type 1 TsaB [Longimicrobiales bacterium]
MLLGIETSTDYGSIAIGRGPDLVAEVVIGARSRHAESLLPALDFMLRSSRLSRAEIRGIVVGAGPGSFTGVRVAAATARGLAAGLAVPLYAFSSLACLALERVGSGAVCSVFDARRGEVYAGCYERAGNTDRLDALLAPEAMHVDELRTRMAGMSATYTGDGARRYADALGIAPPPPAFPRASALLRLAAADPHAGLVEQPSGWEPTYLRSSGAERGIAG